MSFNRFGRSSSSSRSYSRNNSRSRSRTRNADRNASKENTTIWVGGLGGNDPQDVDTLGKILKNVFSDYGRVVDVKMRSTTHDLFAFVQFESHNAAVTAIKKMDQQEVQGRRVKVSWAQFKGSGGRSKQESYRIWVGRIGSSTNENQLRNSFEEFGVITDVKIRSNDKDTFAFIQFQGQRNADRAIKEMNNTRFRGNTIKCDWAQYKNRQQSNGGGKRAPSPRRSNTKFRVDSRSSSRRRSRSYSNNRDDQRFQVTTGESPSAGKKEPTGSPKSKSPPKYYSQSRSKSPSGTPPRVAKTSPPKETEAPAPPKKSRQIQKRFTTEGRCQTTYSGDGKSPSRGQKRRSQRCWKPIWRREQRIKSESLVHWQ